MDGGKRCCLKMSTRMYYASLCDGVPSQSGTLASMSEMSRCSQWTLKYAHVSIFAVNLGVWKRVWVPIFQTFRSICLAFRPHRSITYVDAAYCYRPWSVCLSVSVCHNSEACKNGWTDRDAVWIEDSDDVSIGSAIFAGLTIAGMSVYLR